MKKSHGFFEGLFDKEEIKKINADVIEFINKEKILSNYYSNVDQFIPEVKKLLNSKLLFLVSSLLDSEENHLCNIELHIQTPNSLPIPPHQDNFYHCIGFDQGIKICVPIDKLSNLNGGLMFLDIPYDYPILDHVASNMKNFSSIIPDYIFKSLEINYKSYNYEIGDASYHFLNSIHFSQGNKTNENASFLVFRFESNEANQDLVALGKYENCYKEHKSKLFS